MAVLGELEHRVMDVLWASQEEQSVRDVHTQLLADARIASVSYTHLTLPTIYSV